MESQRRPPNDGPSVLLRLALNDGRLEASWIDVARTCFWPECYQAEETLDNWGIALSTRRLDDLLAESLVTVIFHNSRQVW